MNSPSLPSSGAFRAHRFSTIMAGLLAAMIAGFAPANSFAQRARPQAATASPLATAPTLSTDSVQLHPAPVHFNPSNISPRSNNPGLVGPQRPAPANSPAPPSVQIAPTPRNPNRAAQANPAQTRASAFSPRPGNSNSPRPRPAAPTDSPAAPAPTPPVAVVNTPPPPAAPANNARPPTHIDRPAPSPNVNRPPTTSFSVRNNAPANPPRPPVVVTQTRNDPPPAHPEFRDHPTPARDVHVVYTDAHAGPRFYSGPNHEDFHFVRYYTTPRYIETRASLRNLLLQPLANSVAWGIGNIIDIELARALGLPVYTTLYGVAPGVRVVSILPAGYFVAEPIPANVALVTTGFAGEVVLCNRVTPGSYVAYQTTTAGIVVNEVVVVPPVQPTTTPVVTTVAVEPTPAPAAPVETPAPPAPPSIPVSSKIGKVVYDSAQQPVGVLILANDGSQEFVPLLAQNNLP